MFVSDITQQGGQPEGWDFGIERRIETRMDISWWFTLLETHRIT